MANFDGYVTCEYAVPKGTRPRKNGPFKDIKKFRKEVEKHFITTGDVQIYFSDHPEAAHTAMSFHGFDHPDIRYFPDGVPKDFDPSEGDPNDGMLPFFQCIAEHLIPGAVFTFYYTGNEKLRPPLCGMSWWVHNDYISEVDIGHEKGVRVICRLKNGKWKITK